MQPTTSQARIDANRHNAQLSTGPRTEAGKQASSQNATKHGFFSRLGPAEEPAFRTMLTGLYRSLRPEDEIQQILVDQIGLAYLRLSRIYQHQLSTPVADTSTQDPALSTQHSALLLRYETMLNRQIERNLKLLPQIKEQRHNLRRIAIEDPPFFPDFTPVEQSPVAASTTQDAPSATKPEEVAQAIQEGVSTPEPADAQSPSEAPFPSDPQAPASPACGREGLTPEEAGKEEPARPSVTPHVDPRKEYEELERRQEPEGSRPWPYDPRPLDGAPRRFWRR